MDQRPPPIQAARLPWLDRQRGAAVLLMVAYHFSFDLDQYGWMHQAFNTDLRWLAFRALIVSLFMSALGASLALAHAGGLARGALVRRQLRLGVAALLVTAGSAWMFPASFIWFGILHFAWVATLLALPLRALGSLPLLTLAALVAWAGNGPSAALFDTPWLGWIGFMTHKPYTEDYVPLFPWFAAVLVGLAAAPWLTHRGAKIPPAGKAAPPSDGTPRLGQTGGGLLRRADHGLRLIGRHTLLLYLLHQPILIAALEVVQWTGARPGPP